ncbi:MAG: ABC transporter substrate-binding protein [Lautropia sp.]
MSLRFLRNLRSILASIAVLASISSASAASDKVSIGFLSTLSGPSAEIGRTHLEGFQLALELRGNKLGGVPVDLKTADDKLNPETAVEVARRFVTSDRVDIVTGVIFANVTLAAYRSVVDAGTIFLSGFAGPSNLAGELCHPNLFLTGFQIDTPYEAAGRYVTERVGAKRIFMMAANTPGGKDALAGFKRFYKGEIAGEIYSRFGQPDYSAEISQIRAAKPDALFFQYSGPAAITFMRQVSAAKLGIPIYSSMSMDETTIHGMGEAASGAYSIAPYVDDLKGAENERFVKAYVEKYKKRPSFFAAFGYDTAVLLDRAIAAVNGDLSRKDEFRNAIRRSQYQLARGPVLIGPNNVAVNDIYLAQVVKDQGAMRIQYRETISRNHGDSYTAKCSMK